MNKPETLYGDVLDELQPSCELVAMILDEAKKQGATEAEVGLSKDAGLSIQVRNEQVETLEYNRDGGFAITVYQGKKKGSSTTSDTRPEAIKKAVSMALAIAKQASEDPYAGLVDRELLATDILDVDVCHPWDINIEGLIDTAKNCEQAAKACNVDQVDSTDINSHIGFKVYGNSLGFVQGYPMSRHGLSCVAIAKDQQGNMQRDHWYTVSRLGKLLQSPNEVGKQAAERAIQRLNPQVLTTREVPVLFAPEVARGIWGHFLGGIRGSSLYRKSSFLLESLGQQVFPEWVNIQEMPHLPQGLGSAPFDNEGVQTYQKHFVENGVVKNYVLSSYSARRLNMQTTANAGGVHNCFITSTGQDFTTLLKQMDTGVLVTDVMGQGVNMVTGDYSRGISGFWVENGQLQYPISEMTVAGNLRDMFRNILAVGSDIDTRATIQSGSLLISNMMIAGN